MNPIRKIRRKERLSTIELGMLSGLHPSRINHYELGYAKNISPALQLALSQMGYNPKEVNEEYKRWIEHRKVELLKKLEPRQKKKA